MLTYPRGLRPRVVRATKGQGLLLGMRKYNEKEIKQLYKPATESKGEDNGQVTVVGGSDLFHGAPLLSLKIASCIVDMVFFATEEESVGKVAENIKSQLLSFIWIPWGEMGEYVGKSDAALVGPGLKSFRSEKDKRTAYETKELVKALLLKFKDKRWVIDAGALQVMEADWIPRGAILTPNKKEYDNLFGDLVPEDAAKKYDCVIVLKGPTSLVAGPDDAVNVEGGNPGLTKGGSGDVLAGLAVALLAKNKPFEAAAAAAYVTKFAADELYKRVGTSYNADDLTQQIPISFNELQK